MSDLTAAEWAAEKLRVLHAVEESCSDDDLFCVGYLIPQVELIETENQDVMASQQIWDDHFAEFIEANIAKDQVGARDSERIRELMR